MGMCDFQVETLLQPFDGLKESHHHCLHCLLYCPSVSKANKTRTKIMQMSLTGHPLTK